MSSQKKLDLPLCIKCGTILNDENWLKYLKPKSNYICIKCFRKYGREYYKKYKKTNKNTQYHQKKSAIINAYGDRCEHCGEDEFYQLIIHSNIMTTSTNKMYSWLYDNPIKDGYHILCYNCKYMLYSKNKDINTLKQKQKVIDNYGCACSYCHENNINKLTIIKPKLIKQTGSLLYRWIIKNQYPKDIGLKILCYNCKNMENYFSIVLRDLKHKKHQY